jgi:hypothetical protein
MATGPGKYDKLCTELRLRAHCDACVLIVINGMWGSGFSVQADGRELDELPDLLEDLAGKIRAATLPARL